MKIISGGQTGADRGGLDAAIELDVAHGGWAPKGRKAEDGQVPEVYQLDECSRGGYPYRTRLNVYEADCTLIFTHGKPMSGSRLTVDCCIQYGRTYMTIDLDKVVDDRIIDLIVRMVKHGDFEIINVAGSRESKAPGIQQQVKEIMIKVLKRLECPAS